MATTLLIVLTVGLASQWLAWRVGLPAIVILIASGLLLGPVTGVIPPSESPQQLNALIGMGVAIILFEGGMYLKLRELRDTGHGVVRLVLLGPPLAWLLASAAAYYIGGLDWPVAIVTGAILVVTGPTVIMPLLRQARLNKDSASLLKWEAIANDPVGVLLAVLSFQYFTTHGATLAESAWNLGLSVATGLIVGGAGGWFVGQLYRRGAVPVHLKAPILMVLVLILYWASNQVRPEAGLLSVTLMGLVIGNMKLVEREALRSFEENLATVLLSMLFIIIPAQLGLRHLELIDGRAIAFVLVLMFVVRPATIFTIMAFAPVRRADKLLLGWIAPRGIVAAATAGLFGPALMDAGYPDAEKLLPILFLVIFATVLSHGLSIGRLSRGLGLAAAESNGLLIVGASDFSIALAQALQKLNIDVQISDGAWERLKAARMAGVTVQYGEILSEETEHRFDSQHLSHLLCMTENDFYNALACKARAHVFGHHRTFQIASHDASAQEFKRLSIEMRGYFAFASTANFSVLSARLADGWTIQSTRMTSAHGWEELKTRLDEADTGWLLLGGISPKGIFRLYSPEQRFRIELDWTAIFFAPSTARASRTAKAMASASSGSGSSDAAAVTEPAAAAPAAAAGGRSAPSAPQADDHFAPPAQQAER